MNDKTKELNASVRFVNEKLESCELLSQIHQHDPTAMENLKSLAN
jgi:hypothetical protein